MKKFMGIVTGLLVLFAVSFSLSTEAEAAEKRVYLMQIDSGVPIDRNETVDFYVPITPAPAGKKVVIDYWFTASKYNATPQQEYGIWEASFSDMKGNVYDELKGATVGLSKQYMFTKKWNCQNIHQWRCTNYHFSIGDLTFPS